MDTMWQEYGIEELEKGMQKLFPTFRISDTDPAGRYSGGGGVSVERSHTGNEQFRHRYQKYIDLVDCTGDYVGIADSFCGSI